MKDLAESILIAVMAVLAGLASIAVLIIWFLIILPVVAVCIPPIAVGSAILDWKNRRLTRP